MAQEEMSYCLYYQAHVVPKSAWFLVAALRSFEHVAFDRTLNKEQSIFEFFVPDAMESYFLKLMSYFQKKDIVCNLERLPNRLNT